MAGVYSARAFYADSFIPYRAEADAVMQPEYVVVDAEGAVVSTSAASPITTSTRSIARRSALILFNHLDLAERNPIKSREIRGTRW
jgi:hypothetical protein